MWECFVLTDSTNSLIIRSDNSFECQMAYQHFEEKREGTPDATMGDPYMERGMHRVDYWGGGRGPFSIMGSMMGMMPRARGYRQRGGPKQSQGKSSRENSNNFVGLRNRGNTCYVNSS